LKSNVEFFLDRVPIIKAGKLKILFFSGDIIVFALPVFPNEK